MPDRDEDILAVRSREGDGLALTTLYARHAPALLRYLQRFRLPLSEAEDVLQETFIRLFEGRGRYDGRHRFRSWLYTVATRIAFDRLDSHRRQTEILESRYAPQRPRHIEPAEIPFGERTRRRLATLLDALPRDQVLALHLRFQGGFSYPEMATICDEPEGTLRSRVHHALRRLRNELFTDLPTDEHGESAPSTPHSKESLHDDV